MVAQEAAAEVQADELAAKKRSFDRLRNAEKEKRMKKLLTENGADDELLKYAAAKKPELYKQILEEAKVAAVEVAVVGEHAEEAEGDM